MRSIGEREKRMYVRNIRAYRTKENGKKNSMLGT
jgi:hypothetical protein